MYIFKVFINLSKEEEWLNDLGKQGYILTGVGLRYKFKKTNNINIKYKIDCRNFKDKYSFEDYCLLFKDTGWKHLVGTKKSQNQYFISTREDMNQDIFSDNESAANRYKKLSNIYGTILSAFVVLFVTAPNIYLRISNLIIMLIFLGITLKTLYLYKISKKDLIIK